MGIGSLTIHTRVTDIGISSVILQDAAHEDACLS